MEYLDKLQREIIKFTESCGGVAAMTDEQFETLKKMQLKVRAEIERKFDFHTVQVN